MARIRSIHPGLFTDDAFAALSERAQIFLIGLWTEADDQGAFEWNAAKLRMRLRPIKDGDVDPILEELAAANTIKSYELAGRKYGAIRNFRKWQRPRKPNSVYPMPSELHPYVCLTDASTVPTDLKGGANTVPEALKGDDGTVPANVETEQIRESLRRGRREEVGGRRKEEKQDAASAAILDLKIPPNGYDRHLASDQKTQLYERAKQILGDNSGGLISKLIKAKGENVALARAAIETAASRSDAREYIGAIIRGVSEPKGIRGVDWW